MPSSILIPYHYEKREIFQILFWKIERFTKPLTFVIFASVKTPRQGSVWWTGAGESEQKFKDQKKKQITKTHHQPPKLEKFPTNLNAKCVE